MRLFRRFRSLIGSYAHITMWSGDLAQCVDETRYCAAFIAVNHASPVLWLPKDKEDVWFKIVRN